MTRPTDAEIMADVLATVANRFMAEILRGAKVLTDEERADAFGLRIFSEFEFLARRNREEIEKCKNDPVRLIEGCENMLKYAHVVKRLYQIVRVAWEVGGWRKFFLGHPHDGYRQGVDILRSMADRELEFMLAHARSPKRSTSVSYNLSAQCEAEAAHEVWTTLRGDFLNHGILGQIEKEPFAPAP